MRPGLRLVSRWLQENDGISSPVESWAPCRGHIQGKHHGLPITGYSTVVYYNRSQFQQHGVPPPPAGGSWRWKDLEALAIRFTRREPGSPLTSQ